MKFIERVVNLAGENRNQLINIIFNEQYIAQKITSNLLFPDFIKKNFQLEKISLHAVPLNSEYVVDHIIFAFNLAVSIFAYNKKIVLLNYLKKQKYLTIFQSSDDLTPLEMYANKEFLVQMNQSASETTNTGISDKQINLKNNNLDLCLFIKPEPNQCGLTIAFNNGIYAQQSIDALKFAFEEIIGSLRYQKKRLLRDVKLLSRQHEEMQYLWGRGKSRVINNNIIKQILQNGLIYQDSIAIDSGYQQVSYAQFKDNIVSWIHFLLDNHIRKGDIVCIYLPKCFELYELIIAIMTLGAVYAPIDITHPEERVKYILVDCAAKLLVASRDYEWFGLKTRIVNLASIEKRSRKTELPHFEINPDDPAYIIYTSGTTGNPKGVAVPHKALLNFIDSICAAFTITHEDRFLQFSSLSFDVSIFEIIATFYKGATLCIISDEKKKDPSYLDKFCFNSKVTIAELPPVMLPLLDVRCYECLRLLSVGGEKFPMVLLQPWDNGHRRIVNGYGPTEATVMVTTWECAGQIAQTPLIGKPMDNVNVFVLSPEKKLLPIGAVGELYISGDNLATGYVTQSATNHDKFCRIPFGPQASNKAYRTGDMVRWSYDGNLEILGRADRQVKLNGYRIELNEIEQQILSYPNIEQAVVMLHKSATSSYLFAFFSTNKNNVDAAALKKYLINKLPHYMIPEYIIEYEILPLNHSGKVDHKLLEQICQMHLSEKGSDNSNADSQYKNLIEIVNNIIPGYGADIDKDFFVAGANSLSIARLLAKLNQVLSCKLELSSIYQNPTIKKLQEHLEKYLENDNSIKIDTKQLINYLKELWVLKFTPEKSGSINLVYFHCAGGSAYHAKPWVDHLDKNFNLYSVQLPGHDQRLSEQPLSSVKLIAEKLKSEFKSILRKKTVFIGHSLGALLAYELAKKLPENYSLKALVVIASRPPNILPENPFSEEASDVVFIEKLRTYGGLPDNILENKDLLNLLLPAIRADAMASENYCDSPLKQLDCPVFVFYGNKDLFVDAKMASEWGLFTKSEHRCFEFPAGHFLHVEENDSFLSCINSLALHF